MIKFLLRIALSFKLLTKRKLSPISRNWLDRKDPFSRVFGLDRGSAIDRHFMEEFLSLHKQNIHGNVIEIGDDQYTYQFGANLVSTAILAGSASSYRSSCFPYPAYDLTSCQSLDAVGKFDCVIATNVLNCVYDIKEAINGLATLSHPDRGVVLATLAGVTQISRFDYERWGDYWRLNDMSVRRLFEEYFEEVEIISYGNAPLSAALIMGVSQEEVPRSLFEHHDPDYQILIGVKAIKPKHFRK